MIVIYYCSIRFFRQGLNDGQEALLKDREYSEGKVSALLLQGSRGAARKQIKERDGFNKVLAKTLWNGDERGCIPT